jgi:hypothetical protein
MWSDGDGPQDNSSLICRTPQDKVNAVHSASGNCRFYQSLPREPRPEYPFDLYLRGLFLKSRRVFPLETWRRALCL